MGVSLAFLFVDNVVTVVVVIIGVEVAGLPLVDVCAIVEKENLLVFRSVHFASF